MKKQVYLFLVALTVLAFACTPKTAKETASSKTSEKEVTTTTTKPEEKPIEAKCPTFDQAPNKDKAIEDYVILKADIKAKKYDRAFPLWEKVYSVSPAADGRRNLVFLWGVEIYNHKFKNASSEAEKKEYVEKVKQIYDELGECYPKEKGFVAGRKAFDLYYNYPTFATTKEKYDLFKQAVDIDGLKTKAFVLNPFTALLREQYVAKAISKQEASKYAVLIQDILANGLKTAKGNELKSFQTVEGYAPFRLAEFEAERGFFDCEYYKNKYYPKFEADKNDCDVVVDVLTALKWGNCPDMDAKMKELNAAYDKACVTTITEVITPTAPSTTSPSRPTTISSGSTGGGGNTCSDLMRSGNYQEAIPCLEGLYGQLTDGEKKAQVAYTIAQLYYSRSKKFSKARDWAEKAASNKPGWGKPYLLIGNLYASSGPLCGPGRGWDSQIVIWPAMDMWRKAKSDPETSAKAQKMINKYSQYLPTKDEGFMRTLKEGSSFKVGCWINRTTTAKFKK